MSTDYITPRPMKVAQVVDRAKELGWTVAHRAPGRYVQIQSEGGFATLSQAGDRVSVLRTMGNDISDLVADLGLISEHDPRYDAWVSGKK